MSVARMVRKALRIDETDEETLSDKAWDPLDE
jgi:hypothetical protein